MRFFSLLALVVAATIGAFVPDALQLVKVQEI